MVFPISNARDSLQIDYHYLKRQVGAFLELGYSDAEWDHEQLSSVEDIIRDGLMLYYYPPPLPPPYGMEIRGAHEWSFMRPVYEFSTSNGQRRYPLPPDFERPIGTLAYVEVDQSFYFPIEQTSPSRLRALEYSDTFTSHPQFFALEPGESSGEDPQEQVLVLHPTPSEVWVLSMQYQAHGRQLTVDQPYPLGGQVHGRGILHACLATAELRRDGQPGPMEQKFFQTLAANIVRDQQRGAATIGYMQNGPNEVPWGRGTMRHLGGLYYNNATYNGVDYTG